MFLRLGATFINVSHVKTLEFLPVENPMGEEAISVMADETEIGLLDWYTYHSANMSLKDVIAIEGGFELYGLAEHLGEELQTAMRFQDTGCIDLQDVFNEAVASIDRDTDAYPPAINSMRVAKRSRAKSKGDVSK